jgi:ABC-type transport system involved in cytochrome bd biosynthesis fused ATPase/permease subunit
MPLLTNRLGQAPGSALASRRADLRIRTVDYLQGLPDLLAFERGEDFRAALLEVGRACGRLQQRLALGSGISSAGGVLFSNLGLWAVLSISIPLVTSGRLDGVMLPVLALMAFASFEAIQPLPLAAQMLVSSLASAERLFAIVANDQTTDPGTRSTRELPTGQVDLSVRGLSFVYPGELERVLSDLSFDLPAGRKLALVGPSGAGKSTLVNLLLRFWDAPAGSVRLSGIDIEDLPQETVRENFAVISQRTYLFNATIAENLRLAVPMASQVEIEGAARQANLHEFITSLPLRYETRIGEQGMRLSGGERQRLAIARALLKPAPILLLDEPTENLDFMNAQAVMEVIMNQRQERSVLLITHALAGLEMMDEIIVLNAGRVVERGPFATLVHQAGLFQLMWELQAQKLEESA